MANAWLLRPLPNVGAVTTFGTVQVGAGANLFNDHAGVICQFACDGANVGAIRFDLGADSSFDTIMVFGVGAFGPAGTVTVCHATAAQGPFTGAYTTETLTVPPYAGSAFPPSGIGVTLWSAPAPVVGRHIQLNYIATGAGQSLQASRIVVGSRIQLERNFDFGGSFGVRDLSSLDFSARGVLLRRRGKKLRTAGLTFSHVRKDEVETMTKPLLEQIGNTEMIALVTDPSEHAQRMNRCYYGPLVGDLGQVWRSAAAFEAKTNLVSIF